MRRGAARLAALAWLAAGSAAADVRTIEVDSRLVPCTGVAPEECLRIRGSAEEPWRLFYGRIEGFTFEPGYRYRLLVEEIPVPDPPADAAATRVVLREIVRKLAVEPPADPFAGKVWRLYEIRAPEAGSTIHPTAMITLMIDLPTGRASGKGGCNRWLATVQIRGSGLSLRGVGATAMTCPEPVLAEEQAFQATLARIDGYEIAEHSLTLTAIDGSRLRFRELLD